MPPLTNKAKQKRYREKQKRALQELQRKVKLMELRMYSIRDAKAEAFNPPFYKNTHGEAERDFQNLTRDEKSMVSLYPEDFDLYYVGTYDNITGLVKPLDTPQHVVKAVQLKKTGN